MRRRGVGQLVFRDEIAPADFGAVDAGDVGGVLDQPLHEVGGLRAAGAAIRPALRGVGEHALRHDVHGLDVVGGRHEADRERAGGERRADEIGAHLEQRLASAARGSCRARRAQARRNRPSRGRDDRSASLRCGSRPTSPGGEACATPTPPGRPRGRSRPSGRSRRRRRATPRGCGSPARGRCARSPCARRADSARRYRACSLVGRGL